MGLIIDGRAGHGAKPGVHAFVVGVSDYPFLPAAPAAVQAPHYGIAPLTSAALGAYAFYKWLIDARTELPLPLVTCRLLLAPSTLELANDPSVGPLAAARPGLNNFLTDAAAWRTDASSSADSIAIFYFAGHGVQRNLDDSVLLLEEFGNGVGGPTQIGVREFLRNQPGCRHEVFVPGPALFQRKRGRHHHDDRCRHTVHDRRFELPLPHRFERRRIEQRYRPHDLRVGN